MTIFGREAEIKRLHRLVTDWRASGGLRVVGLIGQPGAGKTTLLSPLADGLRSEAGTQGSLSSDLQIDDDAVRRNIWWAVRLTAPARGRAPSSHCALATHKQRLLEELQRVSGVLHSFGGLREAKEILGGSAQDLILDAVGGLVPGLSTAKTIGTALFKALKYREEQQQARLRGDGLDPKLYASLVETVIDDLEVVASPHKLGLPVIVAIDDAQFLDADPATASLLRELLTRARADGWCLCLAFTQWDDSWLRGEGMRPLLDDLPVELVEVDELSESWQIVLDRAPGIDRGDARAVAAMVGDNPRAVGELADYLVRHPRYFTSRTSEGPLRPDWRDLVPPDVTSLEMLVRDRFEKLPEPARRLLVAAAAAGHRFSSSVSAKVAGVERGDAASRLVNIYARETFLESLDPKIGEFRVPVYHRIVTSQADDYYDPVELNQSLANEVFAFVVGSRRWRQPMAHPDAEFGSDHEALAEALRDPMFKADYLPRIQAWGDEQTNGPPPSEFDELESHDQLALLDLLLTYFHLEDVDSRRQHAAMIAHRALVRYEAGDWTGAVTDGLHYAESYAADPQVYSLFTEKMRGDLRELRRFPELHDAMEPVLARENKHMENWLEMAEPQMREALDEYAALVSQHGDELTDAQRQELTDFISNMQALHAARFIHLPRSDEIVSEFQHLLVAHCDALYDDAEGRPTINGEIVPSLLEDLKRIRQDAVRTSSLMTIFDTSHLMVMIHTIDVVIDSSDHGMQNLSAALSALPGQIPLDAPSLWMLLMWWRRTDAADLILQHAIARSEGVETVDTGTRFLQLLSSNFALIWGDPEANLVRFEESWAALMQRQAGTKYPPLAELDREVDEFLEVKLRGKQKA